MKRFTRIPLVTLFATCLLTSLATVPANAEAVYDGGTVADSSIAANGDVYTQGPISTVNQDFTTDVDGLTAAAPNVNLGSVFVALDPSGTAPEALPDTIELIATVTELANPTNSTIATFAQKDTSTVLGFDYRFDFPGGYKLSAPTGDPNSGIYRLSITTLADSSFDYKLYNTTTAIPAAISEETSAPLTGSSGDPGSLGIQVHTQDTLAPEITYSIDPVDPDGQDGWYISSPLITPACADNGTNASGVAICPDAVNAPDGTDPVVLQAWDNVGNTTDYNVTGLKVDTLSPSYTLSAETSANGNGWYRTNVTVLGNCSDDTSGVASCPGTTLTTEGLGVHANLTASDVAGNITDASTPDVNIDKTAPAVSVAPFLSTGKLVNGWFNGIVQMRFSCTDALSGIATCPANQTLSASGRQLVAGVAIDRAGNTRSASTTVSIDRIAPNVSITNIKNGQVFKRGRVPAPKYAYSDAHSGVKTVTSKLTTIPRNKVTGTFVRQVTATDRAGNVKVIYVRYIVK